MTLRRPLAIRRPNLQAMKATAPEVRKWRPRHSSPHQWTASTRLRVGHQSRDVPERRREEQGAERPSEQPATPFAHPGVMTGYPLSRDEQEHVDQVADRDEKESEEGQA